MTTFRTKARQSPNSNGNTSFYDPTLSPLFATSSLWWDCPILPYLFDPSIAYVYDEIFDDYDATNDWTLTQSVTGTSAILTTAPGTLQLDAGATTDNQGVNLQRLKQVVLPAAGKDIWAEFYISLTASTPPVTKAQLFVGLAASDTTIIAAGAMTTNNRIGWEILDGGLLQTTFTSDKAGVEVTKTGPLLVAATQIRLGFRYDGTADTVQQYVNGAALGTAVATASVPKLAMFPSFVCQSDATDRPLLNLHGYRIFGLR
jgi:hypothetical protein